MKTLETLEKGGKNPGKFRYGYEELGACIPTVVKGNIVNFFCNAVRKWRDNDDGILHTSQTVRNGITLQI
jgi:hypothetical protein